MITFAVLPENVKLNALVYLELHTMERFSDLFTVNHFVTCLSRCSGRRRFNPPPAALTVDKNIALYYIGNVYTELEHSQTIDIISFCYPLL